MVLSVWNTIMRGGRKAVEHLTRFIAGWVIVAGFEQQHAVGAFCAQPVRQHAAGGAGAEDDVVVLRVGHSKSSEIGRRVGKIVCRGA